MSTSYKLAGTLAIVMAFFLGTAIQGNIDHQEIALLIGPTPIPLGPLEVCRTDISSKACVALGGTAAYAGALAAQGVKRDDLGCFNDQGIDICPDNVTFPPSKTNWLLHLHQHRTQAPK